MTRWLSEWGLSENTLRARYYTYTPAGRKHAREKRSFDAPLMGI